ACLFWLQELAARRGLRTVIRAAISATLVASAALGAFAVSSIYRSEHTQIRASRWLYENAPPGVSIGYETTAIDMPLPLPGHSHLCLQKGAHVEQGGMVGPFRRRCETDLHCLAPLSKVIETGQNYCLLAAPRRDTGRGAACRALVAC